MVMRLVRASKPQQELLERAGCGSSIHTFEMDGYEIYRVIEFHLHLEVDFAARLGVESVKDERVLKLLRSCCGVARLDHQTHEALKTELRMVYKPGEL